MASNKHFEKLMHNIEGSEGHDSGALTADQQLQLNQFKVESSLRFYFDLLIVFEDQWVVFIWVVVSRKCVAVFVAV